MFQLTPLDLFILPLLVSKGMSSQQMKVIVALVGISVQALL